MKPEAWSTPLKFYFLILMYSIQRFFIHVFNLMFYAQKNKTRQRIVIPPKCLSMEESGRHQYAKLKVSHFAKNYRVKI
jgi:hypothetical protein